MASESVHDKLKRVRKPRVHITYEVETDGAQVVKELPFIVGVMGDFSGNPSEKLKPFKDRKFTMIDRDNFNEVMEKMTPGLNLSVDNTLKGDGSQLKTQLKFSSIEDFEPARVAQQIEPLKKLLEARDRLRELETRVDLNDKLEGELEKILKNTEELDKLKSELGLSASGDGSKGDE
jgi:type VI secretion system protein ImpB